MYGEFDPRASLVHCFNSNGKPDLVIFTAVRCCQGFPGETQKQRVSGRHAEDDPRVSEWLTSMQKGFEPVQPDEKDAYELIITPEMGKDDIALKVLDLIKDDNKNELPEPVSKMNLQEPSEPKKSSMCILI